MDHTWAAEKLRDFADTILSVKDFRRRRFQDADDREKATEEFESSIDELITLEPVMRNLMNAARPDLGDYKHPDRQSERSEAYWANDVYPWVLRAIGIHTFGVEARERMRPDVPDLAADKFHPWVWNTASLWWQAGDIQEAVQAAARSVNARLQQKLSQAYPGQAMIGQDAAFPGYPGGGQSLQSPLGRSSARWQDQGGAADFAAQCFEVIFSPVAQGAGRELSAQVALEQLAALSLLAQWIEGDSADRVTEPLSEQITDSYPADADADAQASDS